MNQWKRMMLFAALLLFASGSLAGELHLTVSVKENEVVAGVPVVLNAQLSVAGETNAEIAAISPGAGNVIVYVENLDAGTRAQYLGFQWGIDERAPARIVVTNESPMGSEISLLFHNVIAGREDLLPDALPLRPGRYRITVQYIAIEPPVIAAVDVSVRRPSTEGEVAYWAAMQEEPELAKALQAGNFRRTPSVLPVAEALIRRFPESAHSRWNERAISAHYDRLAAAK
jgi:hypothetical protein